MYAPFLILQKKIKYRYTFIFLPNDLYGIEFMKDKKNYTYILRPSNSDKDKALSITYKNNGIHQLKIRMVDNEKWYAEWENDDGEPIQISKKVCNRCY